MSEAVRRLPDRSRPAALALARAALPAGSRFAEGGERSVARLEAMLSRFGPGAVAGWARLLDALDVAARLSSGRRFAALGRDEAEALLCAWSAAGPARRALVLALTAPLKIAHFDDPEIYRALGCTWRFHAAPEPARWMRQVVAGTEITSDTDVECDAVVVGTGAGGAVVAAELAARGLAVVLVEEGEFHGRPDFDGASMECITRLYRDHGTTGAVGNTFIPIPMGRLVGGSTAINTGTCWRTPDHVLDRWAREDGLADLAPDRMAPWFDRVERQLQVEDADARYLGGPARVVARGCDALGWSHRPLRRNAPGCDGSGICDLGCPTGARRSTEIAYIPGALERGAVLYTGVRADCIAASGGRATGVEACAMATGRALRVRARATVVACGTVMTPVLLARSGLARALPACGRNLTIHPATTVSALFDEPIRGYAAIPQGYCIDHFAREGILPMGASAPPDLGSAQLFFVGRKLVEIMEAYDRVASFGVMVEDGPNGRVVPGRRGRPIVYYRLGRAERERLRRGTAIVARVFLAAGAREVWPAVHGHRVLRDRADVERLESAPLAPARDWLVTAFHPLGTCRMATTPRRGVVSPDQEVFGVPGLWVADGSVVPSSLGVNPQETIMALAARAADRIAARLEA